MRYVRWGMWRSPNAAAHAYGLPPGRASAPRTYAIRDLRLFRQEGCRRERTGGCGDLYSAARAEELPSRIGTMWRCVRGALIAERGAWSVAERAKPWGDTGSRP